jgi:hypothetical protein
MAIIVELTLKVCIKRWLYDTNRGGAMDGERPKVDGVNVVAEQFTFSN